MNTTKQQKAQPESKAIEIKIVDTNSPTIVDLKEVFGAINLNYAVKNENYGVVKVDGVTENGFLCLSVPEYAKDGAQSRVAIRASDSDGSSVVAIFRVRIVNPAPIYQVA